MRIETLTKEQEALLPIFRKQWHSIGTCTEPANRQRAEAAIAEMYKMIGENTPKFVWADSPLTANILIHVWPKLGTSLQASLVASLWASLEASLRASLRASLWDSKIEFTNTRHWGQMDAYWIAFYKFCEDIGVKYNAEKLAHLNLHAEIAQSCGWWWPYKNICFVSERPLTIRMDTIERLHSLDSPAVEFRDGWKVFSIHGVRVPEKYVLTPSEQINPEEVLKESNAEIRTAVIKKCGFAHFRKHLKNKIISKANNNELIEFELGNEMKVRGLLVRWTDKHDTKETILTVPRTKEQFEKTGNVPDNIDDCEQVRLWTLGLTANTHLNVET